MHSAFLLARRILIGDSHPSSRSSWWPTANPLSWSLMHHLLYRLLVTVVTLLFRSGRDKDLEIVVLRH